MSESISLWNWSLKKTLAQTSDPVWSARIVVFYYVFLLNFLKIGATLPSFILASQRGNIIGSLVALLITIFVLKLLLSRPEYLNKLIHLALFASTFSVWGDLFLHHQSLNLILLQNVFMICMWSFYGLKGWWGLFYSTISAIPVVMYMVYNQSSEIYILTNQLPPAGAAIIVILNFIIIFWGHYYYRNFLYATMKAKEKLNEELKKSDAAKGLFFSSVSHELRNPLNTVIGMANLLREDSKDQKAIENLDILRFSAGSLLTLINDLLDFDKIGSGKVVLESISFNLPELLENTCAGLRIEAIEKGLYFKIDYPEVLNNSNLLGDPTRLTQIIYNLVGNAIKFTHQGSIEVNVELLEKRPAALLLRFTIKDTGLGISAESQRHIFDPFTQASSTTTRHFGGTGLGLGIVKQLLVMHKSNIKLKSEVNVGSAFSFDILYAEAPLAEPVKVLAPQTVQELDLTGFAEKQVLLAEDNPMNILFMKKLFDRWNIKLSIAENGQQAVRLMHEADFDLVLMDIHMPVMNGYEAAQAIRKMENKKKANVFILALTGSVSEEVFSLVTAAGMNDTLHKPFHSDELYQKLKLVLQEHHSL